MRVGRYRHHSSHPGFERTSTLSQWKRREAAHSPTRPDRICVFLNDRPSRFSQGLVLNTELRCELFEKSGCELWSSPTPHGFCDILARLDIPNVSLDRSDAQSGPFCVVLQRLVDPEPCKFLGQNFPLFLRRRDVEPFPPPTNHWMSLRFLWNGICQV